MTQITNKLAVEDLLIQLAEEAAELAQIAAKYCRAIRSDNPTPVPDELLREAMIEEIADVNVCADAVMRKLHISGDEVAEVESAKIERWERRLVEAYHEKEN